MKFIGKKLNGEGFAIVCKFDPGLMMDIKKETDYDEFTFEYEISDLGITHFNCHRAFVAIKLTPFDVYADASLYTIDAELVPEGESSVDTKIILTTEEKMSLLLSLLLYMV